MRNTNKTYRIRTDIGNDVFIPVQLDSEYDVLEILSLKIQQKGEYRFHTSKYGVLVGRVLANNGFGVPNARLSLFVPKDENSTAVENELYPYSTVGSKNKDGVRYNLLPSNQRDDCHQVVGTFPSKRLLLDNNSTLEVFDKYYLFTTRTNDSGDYMFYGVPTGSYILHMDLDISDCGKLSQRPRDFVYKGYTIEQFENPNQFKTDTELGALSQIFTQDTSVDIKPFWGDKSETNQIGITRADINVAFKFEPTCVFMGSIISDSPNDGISKKCVPSDRMGEMGNLVTGSGTIEIIRKKIDNTIEELQIKGKQLINGNGVWCFQIPMNLDYVMTDEYGNIVPTDNPEKGIPTRCEVRFRISLDDIGSYSQRYHRSKVLVPHNPMSEYEIDYEFGSSTKDDSFKSLMWNNVYSIKSFVPRFQKSRNVKTDKFTGIKNVTNYGSNNPVPYNNIRIKLPFTFWITCNIVKLIVRIVQIINDIKVGLMSVIGNLGFVKPYSYISNEFCPDLENWYFAPGMHTSPPKNNNKNNACKKWQHESACLTYKAIADELSEQTENGETTTVEAYEYNGDDDNSPFYGGKDYITLHEYNELSKDNKKYYTQVFLTSNNNIQQDNMSTELKNQLNNQNAQIKLTNNINYLMQCVEMSLAQEYGVVKFDFYNDWLNGVVYLPRWAREVKYKRKRRNGKREVIEKVKGCINDKTRTKLSRRYVQQCSVAYRENANGDFTIASPNGCGSDSKLKCHKKQGMDYIEIFGNKAGIVQEEETMLGDNVYYLKPKEFRQSANKGIPLYATDIIMLGSLSDCNQYGLPTTFESLVSTTYQLPPNMAATNVDSDSYFYEMTDADSSDGSKVPPTISQINKWECGKKCDKKGDKSVGRILTNGVEPIIPTTSDIINSLKEYDGVNEDTGRTIFEYEDFFPITEVSGIEWGYTGPAQSNGEIVDNKLYAPGGHFMGLSCGNAETNVRSCVNLKRACEIGTTLSERFEVPMGSDSEDNTTFLFVSPNGLISKDQIYDVSFRSAFATMNHNSLKTVINPITNFKEYEFKYLLPDSFDGSFSSKIDEVNNSSSTNKFTQQIKLEYDDIFDANDVKGEYAIESGYTITRANEVVSKDYVAFRGSDYLMTKGGTNKSMPLYLNSFYFYFGLINGQTALDEFKKQYFAACNRNSIIEREGFLTYTVSDYNIEKFTYNIEITVSGNTAPFNWKLERMSNSVEKEGVQGEDNNPELTGISTKNTFIINDINIGRYSFSIIDKDGVSIKQEINVGAGSFYVDFSENDVVGYFRKTTESDSYGKQYNTNGGYVESAFYVTPYSKNGITYGVALLHGDENLENTPLRTNGLRWDEYYDINTGRLWLTGPGEYTIKIVALNSKNGIVGSFTYGKFTVEDGKEVQGIMLGNLTYDEFKDISYSLIPNMENFEYYKKTVNPKTLGNPFFLNFYYPTDDLALNKTVKLVYAGMGESDMGELDNVVSLRENKGKYKLNFNKIVTPVNETVFVEDEEPKERRSGFYFTVKDAYSPVYATESITGTFDKDGKFSEFYAIKYPWHEDGNEYYYCVGDDINDIIELDANGVANNVTLSESKQYTLVKMAKAPVIVYPFKTNVVIVIKNRNTDNFIWKDFDTQCFGQHLNSGNTEESPAISLSDTAITITENNCVYGQEPSDYDINKLETITQNIGVENFGSKVKYHYEEDADEMTFKIYDTGAEFNDVIKYFVVDADEISGITNTIVDESVGYCETLEKNLLDFISDGTLEGEWEGPTVTSPITTYSCAYSAVTTDSKIWFGGVYKIQHGVENNDNKLKDNLSNISLINTYDVMFAEKRVIDHELQMRNPYGTEANPNEFDIDEIPDKHILKHLYVKFDSPAIRYIEIECNDENAYIDGVIYRDDTYKGEGVPKAENLMKPLKVKFLTEDDMSSAVTYDIKINYDNVKIEWALTDEAINNGTKFNVGNYKLKIGAFATGDTLLQEIDYTTNNTTVLKIKGSDLCKLLYFKWRIIYDEGNYTDGETGVGGGSLNTGNTVDTGSTGNSYEVNISVTSNFNAETNETTLTFISEDNIEEDDSINVIISYVTENGSIEIPLSFAKDKLTGSYTLTQTYAFDSLRIAETTVETSVNNTYNVNLVNGD